MESENLRPQVTSFLMANFKFRGEVFASHAFSAIGPDVKLYFNLLFIGVKNKSFKLLLLRFWVLEINK